MEFLIDGFSLSQGKEDPPVQVYDLALEYGYYCIERNLVDYVYILYRRKSIPYRFFSVKERSSEVMKRMHTKFIVNEEKMHRFFKLCDMFLDVKLLVIVHKLDDFLFSDSDKERSDKVLRLNHINLDTSKIKLLFVSKLDSHVLKENTSNLLLVTYIGNHCYAICSDEKKSLKVGYLQCFQSLTYYKSYEVILKPIDKKEELLDLLYSFISLYIKDYIAFIEYIILL